MQTAVLAAYHTVSYCNYGNSEFYNQTNNKPYSEINRLLTGTYPHVFPISTHCNYRSAEYRLTGLQVIYHTTVFAQLKRAVRAQVETYDSDATETD